METQVIPTQNEFTIQDTLGRICLYLGAPITFAMSLGIFGFLLGLPLAWYLSRFRLARRVAFWFNAIALLLMLPVAFFATMR